MKQQQPLPRRLLTLIVHAQDLTHQSKRVAISRALTATNAPPLDFLQLRSTKSDDTTLDALLDAKRCLHEILLANPVTASTPGAHDVHSNNNVARKQPALIVNAPLDDIAALTRRKDGCGESLDGWHVKERDLFRDDLQQMIHRAKARSGDEPTTIVGCSVHSVAAAVHAARLGVDYIQVGTMFSTPSHPEKASVDQLEGPELLQAILSEGRSLSSDEFSLPPLIAVGGISTPQQIRQVVSAGASGVAVIRGILAADDARVTAAQYRAVLDEDLQCSMSQQNYVTGDGPMNQPR